MVQYIPTQETTPSPCLFVCISFACHIHYGLCQEDSSTGFSHDWFLLVNYVSSQSAYLRDLPHPYYLKACSHLSILVSLWHILISYFLLSTCTNIAHLDLYAQICIVPPLTEVYSMRVRILYYASCCILRLLNTFSHRRDTLKMSSYKMNKILISSA